MKQNYANLSLAQRIKLRLERLGKSERGASLEAGLSDSFLRNIRQNKSSSPRIDTLEKIAEVLKTSPSWLAGGEGEEEVPANSANSAAPDAAQPDAAALPPRKERRTAEYSGEYFPAPAQKQPARPQPQPMSRKSESGRHGGAEYSGFNERNEVYPGLKPSPYPAYHRFPEENNGAENVPNAVIGERFALSERRLPVYGQAVGGIDGEFPINGSTLYSVLCPPQLSEISGAYAVSISGDSMYPRYEDGEIAFVDPTRRVKKGDYVIAQIIGEESEPPLAYVKKFIRHNAGGLVLEQFNPQKELHFPHERVVSVHYIALAGAAPA